MLLTRLKDELIKKSVCVYKYNLVAEQVMSEEEVPVYLKCEEE